MRALVISLAALILLSVPGEAAARYDPLAGGSTTLTLDPSFLAGLRRHGVHLEVRNGATANGGRISFPVTGGRLDPISRRGIVEHTGTLVFVAGNRRLPLKELVLKTTQKSSPLAAKFGGGKLKLSASARLTTARAGFGVRARVRAMELSPKVATRLRKKLRLHGAFSAGERLGSAVSSIQPATVGIGSGQATLQFDPGFVEKLEKRFVSINPIFPAEHQGPTFTFPVLLESTLSPALSLGTLQTGGAVELLQLPSNGQIFWQETWFDLGTRAGSAEVDLEPTPKFPGKLGRTAVFDLTVGLAVADEKTRTISGVGVALTLQPATADALNDAFAEGAELFLPGEGVGTLSFTVSAE